MLNPNAEVFGIGYVFGRVEAIKFYRTNFLIFLKIYNFTDKSNLKIDNQENFRIISMIMTSVLKRKFFYIVVMSYF